MRGGLYESSDLLSGYDPADPATFIKSWDYQQYIAYTAAGGPSPNSAGEASRQAQHDAEISLGLRRYLTSQTPPGATAPRLIAIMGGHSLNRGSAAYNLTADIARDLTNCGFLVVTGGGPGAMEAGHVGAYFANASDAAYQAALAKLTTCPTLPSDLGNIIDPKTGAIVAGQEAAYAHATAWLNTALDVRNLLPQGAKPAESLAIPTWLYGSEPTTPFASVYAKYFQNSIREETLVSEGKTGTIYARGSGGTLREIFQGVEHNCYVQNAQDFLPMIFVDPQHYWQTTASYGNDGSPTVSGINLADTIASIFKLSLRTLWPACADKVQFTIDLAEIRLVLNANAPAAQSKLSLLLKGEPVGLMSARFRARRAT